jgi:pSer/pThr/pTyr-binding forkhead associated (FHA) protein
MGYRSNPLSADVLEGVSMAMRLIERGPTAGQTREIPIASAEFLIGRGADCDLRLRETAVSRHHCTIRVSGDEATIVDLGSSNGTFLNGQRVRSSAPLKNGDQLTIGSATFVVDLGNAEQPPADVPDVDPLARTMKLPKQ